jgi:hypothetical protein
MKLREAKSTSQQRPPQKTVTFEAACHGPDFSSGKPVLLWLIKLDASHTNFLRWSSFAVGGRVMKRFLELSDRA